MIKNAGTNATSVHYSLLEVLDKQGVQAGRQFGVPLSTSVAGLGYVSFLSRKLDSTYFLAGRILIDCRSYCGNLDAIIDQELLAEGIFSHGPDGAYVLEELLD